MSMTIGQIKDELPDVPVTRNGKREIAKIVGRKALFATVALLDGSRYEVAWGTLQNYGWERSKEG